MGPSFKPLFPDEDPKHPKVAVIHYPDKRTLRHWRGTMDRREFAEAVARYSKVVESVRVRSA